jgi:hypothetical protein
MTENQRDFVLHLLRQGDWGQAIVAYREEAGVDHEQARVAVNALAAQHGIQRSGWRSWWWWGPAMAALMAIALLWR